MMLRFVRHVIDNKFADRFFSAWGLAVLLFYSALGICLLLVTYVPAFSMWLPNMFSTVSK